MAHRLLHRRRRPSGGSHVWLAGTAPEPIRAGRASWVLARSRCRYRWLPYQGLPPAERSNLLALTLQTWGPFESSGFAVVDGTEGAMLWAWDAAALAHEAATSGLAVPDLSSTDVPLPETLLRSAAGDGAALLALHQGCEGQIWAGGKLVASRWWPQPPDETAWLNFQRSAGIGNALPRPQPTPGELLAEPWAQPVTPQGRQRQHQLRQHTALAALALVLAVPALWLLVQGQRAQARIEALQARADALEARLRPALQVRADALQTAAEVDRMATLLNRPAPLPLLAHLASRWPADGTTLRALEWDGTRLRLALSVPANRPRVAVIQTLEDGTWLRNVREEAPLEGEVSQLVLSAELPASGEGR